ncbi:unnamed protein product [Lactuca saligna]|uniref:Uncharacterized protein n=1 Tax=Lactuca saligna TaxID=75948 RepID=A0AA36EE20_LACSI|nr:unnamed protein product [Lactuca saligna]
MLSPFETQIHPFIRLSFAICHHATSHLPAATTPSLLVTVTTPSLLVTAAPPSLIVGLRFTEEMLRSLLRAVASAQSKSTLIPTSIAASNSKSSQLTSSRAFAAKKAKSLGAKAGNKKAQPKSKADVKTKSKQEETVGSSVDDAAHDLISDERNRRRLLDEDERDMSLDIGPNGRPLFTSAPLSELSRKDACTYMKFRYCICLSFYLYICKSKFYPSSNTLLFLHFENLYIIH